MPSCCISVTWLACLTTLAGCAVASSKPEVPPSPPALLGATTSALELAGESALVTWTCTDDPCPWGDSVSNPAIAWPESMSPVAHRLGYTVSPAPYLPAQSANGLTVSITSGSASLFVGEPDADSHHWLASLSEGESYDVSGLADGEVLSVQSDAADFSYRVAPSEDHGPPPDAIAAIPAFWRCDAPDCTGPAWTGAVINWPASTAYHNNARTGDQSRSVFAADDTPLYPYMGSWAQGCEVTAESGTVLIIEWQRGTDTWRETPLHPRQTHVIDLVAPEDGAMIETYEGLPGFSVSLRNCTPRPL
jgi:hypothetical protein